MTKREFFENELKMMPSEIGSAVPMNVDGEKEVTEAWLMTFVKHLVEDLKEAKKWHTERPTEEGWYLVAYKKRDCDGSYYWEYGARVWIEIIEGEGHWDVCEEKHPVLAWQRIEPYND